MIASSSPATSPTPTRCWWRWPRPVVHDVRLVREYPVASATIKKMPISLEGFLGGRVWVSSAQFRAGPPTSRTLYISGYPFVANSGWMDSLINFNHDSDIPSLPRWARHLHYQNHTAVKSPSLRVPVVADESRKSSGRRLPTRLIPLSSYVIRSNVAKKTFQMAIYVSIRADSLEELDKTTAALGLRGNARRSDQVARYNLAEPTGKHCNPSCREEKISSDKKRNLDSSSAALTFPFMSSELVQESGILYGVNKSNNSLVIPSNRFSLHNANSITFAQSGSGKSYTTKVEILRQLMQGTKVIVIDPEREYKNLRSRSMAHTSNYPLVAKIKSIRLILQLHSIQKMTRPNTSKTLLGTSSDL